MTRFIPHPPGRHLQKKQVRIRPGVFHDKERILRTLPELSGLPIPGTKYPPIQAHRFGVAWSSLEYRGIALEELGIALEWLARAWNKLEQLGIPWNSCGRAWNTVE